MKLEKTGPLIRNRFPAMCKVTATGKPPPKRGPTGPAGGAGRQVSEEQCHRGGNRPRNAGCPHQRARRKQLHLHRANTHLEAKRVIMPLLSQARSRPSCSEHTSVITRFQKPQHKVPLYPQGLQAASSRSPCPAKDPGFPEQVAGPPLTRARRGHAVPAASGATPAHPPWLPHCTAPRASAPQHGAQMLRRPS